MDNLAEFKQSAGSRLKHFIKHIGLSQAEFSEQIGVNSKTLSRALSKGGISTEMVCSIKSHYPGLRWDWVYKGTGGYV